jgi:hypothetical protein
MGQRLDLHAILLTIATNVYFQPPPDLRMTYPAIVYHRDDRVTEHADNSPYKHTKGYSVTVIDRDPDSELPDKVAELPMCTHQRSFTADNLNHDVYKVFF